MSTKKEPGSSGPDHDPGPTSPGRSNGPGGPSKQEPTEEADENTGSTGTASERARNGKVVNTDEQHYATNRDHIRSSGVVKDNNKS